MFRSRTSDNMDRWKAEVERKKREEQKREDQRRERVRRNKMQVREKVYRKVAKHCVFPMICGSRGSKSRLAKAAGAEAAGQMRWRIAGRCGAKHISKSKCTKHHSFGPLLEVEMSKKCTPLWREAHSKSKCTKHLSSGPLLEVEMSKKCTPLWREAHLEGKMCKAPHVRATFGHSDVVSRGRRSRDCGPCQKWAKRWGFCGISVAGAVQKTCSSELLRGPGADFLREIAFWSPRFQFAEMILRDRCQHFVWPGITFAWQAQ